MDKIGVVIPTYNRKELLIRALRSLHEQIYQHWVAVVVDDCSNEDIGSYLKAEGFLEDERIIYDRLEKNSGVNRARNRALNILQERYQVEYITFLDDDDYFVSDYFVNAINIFQNESCKWLVSKCVDESNQDITHISQEGYMGYMDYLTSDKLSGDAAMMIASTLLNDVYFTEHYRNGYEWYFFLHLSIKTEMYVSSVVGKIVCYQENGLTYKARKRDTQKKKFQKESFQKFGYSYYRFLSQKHAVIYRNKSKYSSKIKSVIYYMVALVFERSKV